MKNFISITILTLVFLSLLLFNSALYSSATQTNSPYSQGKVVINVYSGTTPIDNATVCIIETGEYYYTTQSGATKTITIPATSEKQFKSFKDKPFTEYTLLVYKNGYLPHIYYGLKITPNTTKIGVTINLTELGINPNIAYTQSYEYPSDAYSENIIASYKK